MTEKQEQALLEQLAELRDEIKEARAERNDSRRRMMVMYEWLLNLGTQCRNTMDMFQHLKPNAENYLAVEEGKPTERYRMGFDHGMNAMVYIHTGLVGDVSGILSNVTIIPTGFEVEKLPEIPNIKQNIIDKIQRSTECLYFE
jgi:hypothetical protein